MSRADFNAVTAADTVLNIDLCKVINNLDCICRAFALALHAADAAIVAYLHNSCAFVFIGALWLNHLAFRKHLDNALRTCICTCTAADTLGTVYLCYAVYNVHCIEITCLYAVAKTDACKCAQLVALAAKQHCCAAVLRT